MPSLPPNPQEIPGDPPGPSRRNPPRSPIQLLLGLGLLAVMLGVLFSYARSDLDWDILQTKHYWSADKWYYGGYAGQFFETPKGYRTVMSEGLFNYTNMFALQEHVGAGQARHPVQGFPGTERLATRFLVSALLHAPGETADVWRVFWWANVLLWILSVFLAYRVAALFFRDRLSPWFAAILVALYPALTLTFNVIKQQPLGGIFLLMGIYLFEAHLRQARAPFRVVALAAVMFFGQFADGGWFFLAGFIFLRAWWLPSREKWATIFCLAVSVGISGLWLAWLGRIYHLPSALHTLDLNPKLMLAGSFRWLGAWITGSDVRGLSLFGFPGFTFFTVFWPVICKGFLAIHAPLVLVALAGLLFEPRSTMFTFLMVPMLFVGHSGTMATGWGYHYGYLSFPAAIMAILAASAVLGGLAGKSAFLPRIAAFAIAAYSCWCFTDLKKQAGVYYGGDPESYRRKIEVHYGNETEHDSF